ncbi:hypothetical protein ES703_108333 [subsurface metagenome]
MLKVYILPVDRIENTDRPRGSEYIHDFVLIYDAGKATLIQDTTPDENMALSALAIEVRSPRKEEEEKLRQSISLAGSYTHKR